MRKLRSTARTPPTSTTERPICAATSVERSGAVEAARRAAGLVHRSRRGSSRPPDGPDRGRTAARSRSPTTAVNGRDRRIDRRPPRVRGTSEGASATSARTIQCADVSPSTPPAVRAARFRRSTRARDRTAVAPSASRMRMLAPLDGRPREHQARDVRTTDQQQHADGAEQRPQAPAAPVQPSSRRTASIAR